MTEAEVEQVVLDTVRRFTLNEAATSASQFERDLRLSDTGRQMLFASLVQAFAARGVGMPSQGFYLAEFLACPTAAAVGLAIRARVFGTPPAPAGASGKSPAMEQKPKVKPKRGRPKARSAKPKSANESGRKPKKAAGKKAGPPDRRRRENR